jgi:toxin-antitoxin system PIN domain toxin
VILVDASLLLYAYNTSAPEHVAARDWWSARLDSPGLVGLAWVTILAFLRITTSPRVYPRPFSGAHARRQVDLWLERSQVRILQPGERHWPILRELLATSQSTGPLTTDAHLAALALEHGASLCSTDRDFTRFPGLTWENPLDRPARD